MLRRFLWQVLHDCLGRQSPDGWHTADSITAVAEPLCAMLNLYHFIILREGAQGTNWTGKSSQHSWIDPSTGCLLRLCTLHETHLKDITCLFTSQSVQLVPAVHKTFHPVSCDTSCCKP